jgi:hypothetical protein
MSKDVEVLVADIIAQKILNAIDFPVLIKVPNAKVESEDSALGEAEIEIVYTQSKSSDDAYVHEVSRSFEDFLLEVAKDVRDGAIDLGSEDLGQVKAMQVIAGAISGGGNPESEIQIAGDEVREALVNVITKATVSVDIDWIKVEAEKPVLRLGNPISLSSMVCKVQARIRACIRVLGKKICVSLTTPRMRLEGREANLALSSQGAITFAQAQFKDLDFVIKIKIWKWSFEIRIGITSLVNKQLRKQGPLQILDLSPLEQPVPFSAMKVKIHGLSYSSKDAGLLVGVDMEVK